VYATAIFGSRHDENSKRIFSNDVIQWYEAKRGGVKEKWSYSQSSQLTGHYIGREEQESIVES